MTEEIPEFQDLREVDAMLEERVAQWKDEYIRQGVMIGKAEGRAEGISIGETRGLGLALRKLTLSAYHAGSLQEFIDQLKKNDTKLM